MKHILLFVLLLTPVVSSAESVVIVSDGAGWKASPTEAKGWNEVDFDDSNWKTPVSNTQPVHDQDPFAVDNCFGFDSKAGWLQLGQPVDLWLRGTLEIPAGFRRAEMLFCIDDLGELWINGELAEIAHTSQFGYRGCAVVLDLLPWIHEGRNQVAVHAKNVGGPMGFCFEARIDGASFVPHMLRDGSPLTAEMIDAVKEFAKRLDAESVVVRDAAEQALTVMSREQGITVVDLANEVLEKASPEAKARMARVGAGPQSSLWEPEGPGDKWAYAPFTPTEISDTLSANRGVQWSLLRFLVASRACLASDPKPICKAISHLASDPDDERSERGVRLIVGSGLPGGPDVVRGVLRDRPASRSGAFAAAALARFGNEADIPALEAASKCGSKPTERAAAAALRILKQPAR